MRSHRSEPQIAEAYKAWYKRTLGGTIADPMLKEREEFFNTKQGEVKDGIQESNKKPI